jgi:hypothetical protein
LAWARSLDAANGYTSTFTVVVYRSDQKAVEPSTAISFWRPISFLDS